MQFKRYKQNLRLDGFDVISYSTKVAEIDYGKLEVNQLGWWSVTTQKHINYVANELGFKLNRNNY